ncbi:MAG: HD domain-containing protein [Sphingomonadaceae bacterium]|nr:HD domain-containing protein [Sphingomonadaceae bacterium]
MHKWPKITRLSLAEHEANVSIACVILSKKMDLDDKLCSKIGKYAALHDIGKFFIDPTILDKEGPLSANEIKLVREHPIAGYQHLMAHSQAAHLEVAAQIALNHHEHWDGTGYPYGKVGADISLPGRIVAVCDVYAALRERRPYKIGMGHAEAVRAVASGAGAQFDPKVIEAFLQIEHRIERALASRFTVSETG